MFSCINHLTVIIFISWFDSALIIYRCTIMVRLRSLWNSLMILYFFKTPSQSELIIRGNPRIFFRNIQKQYNYASILWLNAFFHQSETDGAQEQSFTVIMHPYTISPLGRDLPFRPISLYYTLGTWLQLQMTCNI